MTPLNLFYDEPDPDRLVPFDRYPRRVLRRLLRSRPMIGGQRRVFLNLCAGLDRLAVPYRVNDFKYAGAHPDEPVCIIGKPHVLDLMEWRNPIYFGAAVFSHPSDDPDLFTRRPVRRMLVPGEWMRRMCEPVYGDRVSAWPVGIDTDRWAPASGGAKDIDVLVYDKVRWEHDRYDAELLTPVRNELARRKLTTASLRYGFYQEDDFQALVRRSRSMLFFCEHETQGIAYQQVLASGVPILAWDRGGYWQDPDYYPHRARFQPVSSVPYWDSRCGLTFSDLPDFRRQLEPFWSGIAAETFNPRQYVLDNLTLERSARHYLALVQRPPAHQAGMRTYSTVV